MKKCWIIGLIFMLIIPMSMPAKTKTDHAANKTYTFMHFSVNEGLSQNTVLSCCQDSLDRMWFATLDGLSRYDGYEFKVYKNEPEDSTSIAGNIIRKVYMDKSGRLWIGTGKGLSLYDTERDAFRNFPTQDRAVTGIADIGENRIMVAAGGEIFLFDTMSMKWSEEAMLHQAGQLGATILYSEQDKVWIGTDEGGLFCWSAGTGSVKRIFCPPHGIKPVQCLFKQVNLIWIATEGDGLWCYVYCHRKVNSFATEK